MTFRIADTFTAALGNLSAPEQKAAKTAAFDLQMNPAAPGLSLHRVDRAKDPHFWTARASRDIRLVLHKDGGNTLLAWVGHHDDAYAWAERRRIETHPRTGAAQIVEIRETVEDVVIQRYVEEAVKKPRLFAEEPDETLLSWGVPEDWLLTVRDATEDTVLDIAGHLPPEAGEALLQAAVGERPTPVAATAADPWSHPDAVRRFKVMENEEELAAALEAPWERWAVFLHPAQREFVERDFNGPARIIGSAGTGKTVVALHRAVRLAKEAKGEAVLVATFSPVLAEGLAHKLDLLATGDLRRRLRVGALPDVLEELHADLLGPAEIVEDDHVAALLEDAAAALGVSVSPEFLQDEWRLVVDAWDVRDGDTYRDLPRLGRKVRMAQRRRDELWAVFARVRGALEAKGLATRARAHHDLARHLAETGEHPFAAVVVDEAQDISVSELHVLAALSGGRSNALFFAGDIGQRIFRPPFPWKLAGVEIAGRSRSLKVNYRTSQQIRARTDLLLPPSILEADGGEDRRRGVVSLFEGPAPEIAVFENAEAEAAAAAAWLRAAMETGIAPAECAVLYRGPLQAARAQAVAVAAAGGGPRPRVLPMHDAKGAEFRAVAVIALDAGALPDEARIATAADEASLEEILATERHLLYVAATRARERLRLSAVAPASEFFDDLRK
ncbi:UvrD-helicase domain-containing protein [Rhodovulum sp. DZ06]|uniref:UvrD-helicase domain-containing protein n=1 Tax=Rhodovulum sp. DZ06 TaxID=3425126 RepID=UPI003D3509C8